MAHKKAGGSSKNGRDSESKRLGVKVFGGQAISAGGIRGVETPGLSGRQPELADQVPSGRQLGSCMAGGYRQT